MTFAAGHQVVKASLMLLGPLCVAVAWIKLCLFALYVDDVRDWKLLAPGLEGELVLPSSNISTFIAVWPVP